MHYLLSKQLILGWGKYKHGHLIGMYKNTKDKLIMCKSADTENNYRQYIKFSILKFIFKNAIQTAIFGELSKLVPFLGGRLNIYSITSEDFNISFFYFRKLI